MANLSGTATVSRTRSTRVASSAAANGSDRKLAPSASLRGNRAAGGPSATTSTTTTTTTTMPPPTSAPAPTTIPLSPPPLLSLFLTNLRLLNLDRRPDWPDLTLSTFTSTPRDGTSQKRRVQAVEWALYHLFRLWDADETRAKLQPFFPPQDQVQSVNLRAALLRGLEQVKKSGVLGREVVVRRGMLDECKGERLEEVLVGLSAAVLRKVVAEKSRGKKGRGGYAPAAVAERMALEGTGGRTEMGVLVLAHKVSLRRMLEDKNAARVRFREFSDLLDAKEMGLVRKRGELEAAKRRGRDQAVAEEKQREVCRVVRNNWTGDERWLEALLYGDSQSHKDGVLTAPYDRVWRRMQTGRLAELEDTFGGLVGQLEGRVRGQQERLQKWQGFRQRMFGKAGAGSARKGQEEQVKQRGIDLGFRAHETLRLDRMSPKKLPRAAPKQLDSHYEALVKGLQADLAKISPPTQAVPSFFERPQLERPRVRTEEDLSGSEVISEISDIEHAELPLRPSPSRRDPIKMSEERAFEPVLRKAKTFDDEHHAFLETEPLTPSRIKRASTVHTRASPTRRQSIQKSPTKTAPERRLSAASKAKPPPTRLPASPRHQQSPSSSPPQSTIPSPEPPSSPEDRSISPTQDLASDILTSSIPASPSPLKKVRRTLSLAERTRLSMARKTSLSNLRVPVDEDAFDEETDTGPSREDSDGEYADDTVLVAPSTPQRNHRLPYEDLAARTRRSIANSEPARQRAQLERRRSLRPQNQQQQQQQPSTPTGTRRGSYFPAVDEEGDGDGDGDGDGQNTTLLLTEALLNAGREDDYEAVFMSRPKLKTSPVGTPRREYWD
ncbi:HAUS augmin-like complex subunit 6 N-terminus-domain-containing protein [Dichotomopilus funicola]|uniref:HAUS augmin-like complex subunit 6 N-terminus-domain-containing protein n=1 Tax=Dichotomopilus funicola TaxID=1934379 RepID=A0AAN6V6Y2_9PEZI|nr:HAUS augmin-like complex subunit 6 N-terminus-domain-containing protein [Dichotomopilus funicola]